MAQKSRKARYHAQVKRELSLAKRYVAQVEQERVRSTSLLLLLLAKSGGEATLEKAFLDDVKSQIAFMGYEHRVTEEGDVALKVVVNEAAMAAALEAVAEGHRMAPIGSQPASKVVLTDGGV